MHVCNPATDEDHSTHRLLLERWPAMIERARGIDLRDVVTRAMA